MNTLAINQTLLGNYPVLGGGFTSGSELDKIENINGWLLYINGINDIEKISFPDEEFQHILPIGQAEHRTLIVGMPTCGGVIRYDLYESEQSYMLVVGAKLDPTMMGESDMQYELAAYLYKEDLSDVFLPRDQAATDLLVARNMLYGHFLTFLDRDNPKETVDDLYFDDDGTFLEEIFQDYIQAIDDLKMLEMSYEEGGAAKDH